MIELRRVTDINELMAWRSEVIVNVFGIEPGKALEAANRHYYQRHIVDDSHIAYVALHNGEEAGCGAICLTEELPSPDNPGGRCGYLMNIYIRKNFRCHGYAHELVKKLVEIAVARGCGKIYLESTEVAKSLYASIGFIDMDNMMKYGKTDD